LEQTFNEIVRRHSLTHRFGMVEEQLVQAIAPIEYTPRIKSAGVASRRAEEKQGG